LLRRRRTARDGQGEGGDNADWNELLHVFRPFSCRC
jgi:hypothetical protein